MTMICPSSFEPVLQTALDLGAGVEQPFDCLIVQNRQAVLSMRRSMDWTLEQNLRQKVFICVSAGALHLCEGLDILKIDKKLH